MDMPASTEKCSNPFANAYKKYYPCHVNVFNATGKKPNTLSWFIIITR